MQLKKLTENQLDVLSALRMQNCPLLAQSTEKAWSQGKEGYIDSRVNVRGIRRKHAQGNKEALVYAAL